MKCSLLKMVLHEITHIILNQIFVRNSFQFAIIFGRICSCLPRIEVILNATFKAEWLTTFVAFWQVRKRNILDLIKYASLHKCREHIRLAQL